MRSSFFKYFPLLICLLFTVTIGSVCAIWKYAFGGVNPLGKEHTLGIFEWTAHGIYITKVELKDSVAIDNEKVNGFTQTTLSTSVDLGNSNNSSVTYYVTVYNSYSEVYGYSAYKYDSNTGYDNSDIKFTLTNLEIKTPINPSEYHTFEITYHYDNNNVPSNTVLNSAIEFLFLPIDQISDDNDNESDSAASAVTDRFKEILDSDKLSNSDYEKLTNQLDDSWANGRWWDDSYIGTVIGASNEDRQVLNELFAGDLTININGVETTVTIMVKRENIDGKRNTGDSSGNEMTIYMTTDPLNVRGSSAPVYVSVYTKLAGANEWTNIGPMYEGTATVVAYSGSSGTGSFNTDTWRSTNANGQTAGRTINQLVS